jgi:transposase
MSLVLERVKATAERNIRMASDYGGGMTMRQISTAYGLSYRQTRGCIARGIIHSEKKLSGVVCWWRI